MNQLYVMLPCYNEERDIAPLIQKWVYLSESILQHGYNLNIYCIDDKSIDSTNSVIRELALFNSDKIHLIEHKVNMGLGGVLLTAFSYFNFNGKEGDICLLMDGDNTHDPKYVLDMLEKINFDTDCIIASRYCKLSQIDGVPFYRVILSECARIFYSLLFHIKNVKDYTCGYRLYTYPIIHSAVEKWGKNFVEQRSFACMMEVLYKISLIGAKFIEIPFELQYYNKQGQSKMHILKTIKESIFTVFYLKIKYKKKYFCD